MELLACLADHEHGRLHTASVVGQAKRVFLLDFAAPAKAKGLCMRWPKGAAVVLWTETAWLSLRRCCLSG